MIVYCDTSFLVSYLNEADVNYSDARKIATRFSAEDFVVCEIHLLEFPAAVRAATHRQNSPLPEYIARSLINRFDRAVNGKMFIRKMVNLAESLAMARSLGEAHGWRQKHTAFDLWHLGAAWSFSAGKFLTFDRKQASLARLLGMSE
jgi:predicted nucleic acid-binding protein